VVVISTMLPPSGTSKFVVNGTSLTAMQQGWNQLVLGTTVVTV
jgi:hypothetical protein